jgi:acyl carrier protein
LRIWELNDEAARKRVGMNSPGANLDPRLLDLIAGRLGVARERVVGQAEFVKDLGTDWLDLLDLIIVIEDHFGIEIDDLVIDRIKTVHHLIEVIEERRRR